MHESCAVCGQAFDLEVGFYYGSSYASYGLSVGISAITAILWWLVVGFSVYDNSIFYWLGVNILLLIIMQPWLMRLARSIWLALFVRFDPNWQHTKAEVPERMIDDLKNAW